MAEGSFTYFNKNNGDVVTFPRKHARLEHLQNWVSVDSAEHLAELQADRDGTRSGRGNLLGSSNIGDRIEERHQVPGSVEPDPPHDPPAVVDPTPDPPVTEPVVETPVPDPPAPEPIPGPDPADRPARSAVRAEWVEWAVKSGASRTDAESMTKADLIEVYGE